MLNATEIRNVKFSKSMGGYKQEEVDVLLDKVEADYAQFERIIADFQAKNEELSAEIAELKKAQDSVQNVLLSAQRLADSIVSEAKEKSEEIIKNAEANITAITAKEKELSATLELKAQERKAQLENELEQMIEEAKRKAESITAAANDSVARQQMLFDKLKMDIAAFKSAITAKYKEHLELLSVIPDTVPMDPAKMSELVLAEFDKAPAPASFVSAPVVEEQEEIFDDAEDDVTVAEPVAAPQIKFQIDESAFDLDEDEE